VIRVRLFAAPSQKSLVRKCFSQTTGFGRTSIKSTFASSSPTDDDLLGRIDAVDLKHVLGGNATTGPYWCEAWVLIVPSCCHRQQTIALTRCHCCHVEGLISRIFNSSYVGDPLGRVIAYDRGYRCLIGCKSNITDVVGLKHLIKAEPEERVHEHAECEVQCDARPSFLPLWVRRAHDPQLSPAPASASHGQLPAGTLPRSLPRLEPRPQPGQRRTLTGNRFELASPFPVLVRDQAALPAAAV
jgi:hypothetical protein